MRGRAAVVPGRVVAAVLTLAYLVLIGSLTLGPGPETPGPSGPLGRMFAVLQALPATGWVSFATFEFTANVAMFTPLGLLLTLWWGRGRSWYVLLVGLTVSVGIELAQRHIPGRVSDPRDVASNTLGTLVGIVVGLVVLRLHRAAAHRREGAGDSRAQSGDSRAQ